MNLASHQLNKPLVSITMESLGFNIWGIFPPFHSQTPRKRRNPRSKSDSSVEPTGGAAFRFPIKQAATAATLAVTGATVAQLRERWVNNKSSSHPFKVPRLFVFPIYIFLVFAYVVICSCGFFGFKLALHFVIGPLKG